MRTSRGQSVTASLPIEVDGGAGPPLGMPPEQFLRDYWQQRPLLVRGAFRDFVAPLDANDLAGLACEPIASARIVVHDPVSNGWTLELGPFEEHRFTTLPERDWTLLVQDCDKLLAEVDSLLEHFRFVPDWRVDDVMVSYAAPGGSVGAHVDLYDVFLLQAEGHRRWQIDARRDTSRAFRDDVELKMLREFSPTHDWTLAPGDMLYLPPDVPHHGVAVDHCLTCSIGMRAPSLAELVTDAAEFVADRTPEARRLRDGIVAPPNDPARIATDVVAQVRAALRRTTDLSDEEFSDWFGSFITRYRAAHEISPPPDAPTIAAVRSALGQGALLHRHPWSRYAWQLRGRRARLHFSGQAFNATPRLARLLQSGKRYRASDLDGLSVNEWNCVRELLSAGHLVMGGDDAD